MGQVSCQSGCLFQGVLLLPLGGALPALDHQDKLPPGLLIPVVGGGLSQGGAPHLLVDLGQLPAQGHPPLGAEHLGKVRQSLAQLVGRLVKDHGPVLLGHGLQVLLPAALVHAEEPLEGEPSGGQPADGQGGHRRRGAGHHVHGDVLLGTGGHQGLSRVGDGRHARVGHQGAGLALLQPRHDQGAVLQLVVLKVGDERLLDAEMV